MSTVNPCLLCGVCCCHFRVTFHWLEAENGTLGGVPLEFTEPFDHHRLVMKGTNEKTPRCIALEGDPGHSARCGIHPRRPSVCREFEASFEEGRPNDRCDRVRAKFGLPPLSAAGWE